MPLRWATYLGGTGDELNDDRAQGIATDGAGNVYVTGAATSADFPTTPGAAQPSYGTALGKAFVASYDTLGHVRWATYLGGETFPDDEGDGIAVDGQGHVYVTGNTQSSDFPVTPGAAQPRARGSEDVDTAFVASYDAQGHVRWATYLGGSGVDAGHAVATDGVGNVSVAGETGSTDFPVTPGVFQTRCGGLWRDAFAASYDSSGHLRWATYLGGADDDEGYGIATGGPEAVYITGNTESGDFPITPGAVQSIYHGGSCGTCGSNGTSGTAFVARLVVPAVRPAALDPASPPAPGTAHTRYFPSTHHALAAEALALWDRLGGTPTLGLPLSEPFTLAGQRVQVTERAVLLLDLDGVQLLPLGRILSAARTYAPVAPVSNSPTQLYFASTGHTLSGRFLAYWQAHQGSTLLGAPISQPDREGLGDGTGRVYLVQWFVNGRLEYHPEHADPRYQVEQGRVGYEYLHRQGLL